MEGKRETRAEVVTIEVRRGAGRSEIEGTIKRPGTSGRHFSGWLELISVLESWRVSAPVEAESPAESVSSP